MSAGSHTERRDPHIDDTVRVLKNVRSRLMDANVKVPIRPLPRAVRQGSTEPGTATGPGKDASRAPAATVEARIKWTPAFLARM